MKVPSWFCRCRRRLEEADRGERERRPRGPRGPRVGFPVRRRPERLSDALPQRAAAALTGPCKYHIVHVTFNTAENRSQCCC